MVVAGLVGPGARGVRAGQVVDRRTTVGEVLDRRRDLADEQDLRALRRPDAQVGVGDAARHGLLHHRLELGLHLRRARDDVDGAEQGLGDAADLLDLPVDADAAAVALVVAGGPADRLVEHGCGLVVLAVGEQDRVALHDLRHGGEQHTGHVEPGRDLGAAARAQPRDRVAGLGARGVVHRHHRRAGVDERVGEERRAVAGDHREVGAVDDLGERRLRGRLGRGHRRLPHRAGGVDDDDLARRARARLPGRAGARAVDGDDRVHVGPAVGQELVLVDARAELSHGTPLRLEHCCLLVGRGGCAQQPSRDHRHRSRHRVS